MCLLWQWSGGYENILRRRSHLFGWWHVNSSSRTWGGSCIYNREDTLPTARLFPGPPQESSRGYTWCILALRRSPEINKPELLLWLLSVTHIYSMNIINAALKNNKIISLHHQSSWSVLQNEVLSCFNLNELCIYCHLGVISSNGCQEKQCSCKRQKQKLPGSHQIRKHTWSKQPIWHCFLQRLSLESEEQQWWPVILHEGMNNKHSQKSRGRQHVWSRAGDDACAPVESGRVWRETIKKVRGFPAGHCPLAKPTTAESWIYGGIWKWLKRSSRIRSRIAYEL